MSGGEWDYFHRRFLYEMEDFCKDIKERFPDLTDVLLNKTQSLCEILNDIDYDVSGDTIIESDKDFEQALADAMNNPRFIPYIQLHEFEGLLFAAKDGFEFLPDLKPK